MQRHQILITPQIALEIKKISQKQGFSQSRVIRQLLDTALGISKSPAPGPDSKSQILLHDLSTFSASNQRINGFKELYSVGGKTVDLKILDDSAFRYFLKHKKLPGGLEYQIIKASRDMQALSLTQKLVVRRAYVVPGIEHPPGPRFLGLRSEEVIPSIEKVYAYAIEHEYHLVKKSQICVFFLPFIDPPPVSLPLPSHPNLPYGGYAVPLNDEASRVEVFAVWGNNEGVQSFDAIDRYVVSSANQIILKKDIPQKTVMLCTTADSQSEKMSVPVEKQFEQVLRDTEILEVARVVKDLTHKYGLRRVEFSFDGSTSIYFNESSNYVIREKINHDFDRKGTIRVVSSENDVAALQKLPPKEAVKYILYIDKNIIENRHYDLLNNLAGLKTKFTVFYPGLSATAHAVRVLNDFGHDAIVVGNRIFSAGEQVLVKVTSGQVIIEKITSSDVKQYAVNLFDARLFGRETVGGKAYNLSQLKSHGFNVPHGLVLTTSFFDLVKHGATAQEIADILTKIVTQNNLDPTKKYAVRSSANVEDQLNSSFAGQFKTYLNVSISEILPRILQVIASTTSDQVQKYLSRVSTGKNIKMAVVVQEMVDAHASGVVFGKDLQTGDTDLVIIDAALGLGEGVVDGVTKTHRIIYSRNKDTLINSNGGAISAVLSRPQIDCLIELSLNLENLMGRPQDIEWAIDQSGSFWLIQTRDL